ncbi:hypothetical protein ACHAXA_003958 [Cyclostephanos tholiformis]|uniref:Glycosyl transferase CAP10 domain-containing protein n=1 Tax=Cyclostephanos tholiformis TaxID=382380 RepID=A0ABD3R363_9STRA
MDGMKRRFKQIGGIDHHVTIERERQPRRESNKRQIKISGLACLLSSVAVITNVGLNGRKHKTRTVSVSYRPPSNVSNELLATFENVMSSANLSLPPGFEAYVPIILENGNILCRNSHKGNILNARIHSFIELLKAGMEMESNDAVANNDVTQSIPIILIESDASGCLHGHHPQLAKWLRLNPRLESRYSIHDHADQASFPRLTWHTPAPKYGTGWCKAIGMTGYESASMLKEKCDSWFFKCSWDQTFKYHESKYPWHSKIDRAVWRGSTTGWQHLPFNELPRAKLVKMSMDRPDIIDAGFTSFVQGWKWRKLMNQTIAANVIPFEDLMKYRAIIDIDGNAWSSRFTKLLCTNSVVIKIDPDYIEYFYANLHPMLDYVPASLQNLTEVIEYVLDKKNEHQMKSIVDSANSWCKRTITKEQLANDAMSQLRKYETALFDTYDRSWEAEWISVRERIMSNIGDDLVDCSK